MGPCLTCAEAFPLHSRCSPVARAGCATLHQSPNAHPAAGLAALYQWACVACHHSKGGQKAAVVARRYDAAGAFCCVFGPRHGLQARWYNQRAIIRRVHALVEASSGADLAGALYAVGMR